MDDLRNELIGLTGLVLSFVGFLAVFVGIVLIFDTSGVNPTYMNRIGAPLYQVIWIISGAALTAVGSIVGSKGSGKYQLGFEEFVATFFGGLLGAKAYEERKKKAK
jgi:uncharacterized membrane protein